MAGDWIKMRMDLLDDPAVIMIAEVTGLDEFGVVGRLHTLWSWADEQSRDGHALSVTESWIDRKVSRDGFALAMAKAGWLLVDSRGVSFPNFDRHNGKTAKNRALAKDRKVTQRSREERDESVTREEKRREESKSNSTRAEPTENPPPPPAAAASRELQPPTPACGIDALLDVCAKRGIRGAHKGLPEVQEWPMRGVTVPMLETAIAKAQAQKGAEPVYAKYLHAILSDNWTSSKPTGRAEADAKVARTAAATAEQRTWESAPMPDSLKGFVHKPGSA